MNKKRITFCSILLVTALFFVGCAVRESEQQNTYDIYSKNLRHTGLIRRSVETAGTEREELIEELWELSCKDPGNQKEESVVPEEVTLLKAVIDGTNLNLYFNSEVQAMDTMAQLLFRAALVKTFTEIDGIESVTFFVDEKPLTDASYNPLGAQKASDYVDIVGNGLSSTKKITLVLYYTDETGEKLLKSTRDIVYESSYSLERDVINRLIQGPDEKGYYSTLPSELQVISVNVKGGTCYVNFDSAFVTEALPISGYTIVYSIVNSLCELPDVRRVQIMVDGDSSVTFKENISLANPLERNLNY